MEKERSISGVVINNMIDDEVYQYINSKRGYLLVKRMIDIVLSLIALVILMPFFVLLALIIVIDSPGKIFFIQERVGKEGEIFKIYKFRSMNIDAESKRNTLLEKNKMDGPVFKIVDDPRVTKVGRFMRKTSLDELPQLFNILRGDMSIVGPRPLVTYETKEFNTYQNLRHNVKPGLTCYWQIAGRNEVSFNEWMDLDIKYIKEISFKTDFLIFLKTIKVVLLGIGAY